MFQQAGSEMSFNMNEYHEDMWFKCFFIFSTCQHLFLLLVSKPTVFAEITFFLCTGSSGLQWQNKWPGPYAVWRHLEARWIGKTLEWNSLWRYILKMIRFANIRKCRWSVLEKMHFTPVNLLFLPYSPRLHHVLFLLLFLSHATLVSKNATFFNKIEVTSGQLIIHG